MAEEKLYLYPVWLRIWHGVNAIGILVLIITGISLQFSNTEFSLINFELAINLHNIFGVIVSISYLVFFVGNLVTPNKKYYHIKRKKQFRRLVKQGVFYMSGMFKGEDPPYPISEKRKFNPLQKYSYVVVMYLFLPITIITGIALLFPELIIEDVYSISGIFLTAVLHAALGFMISIFLIIHIYVAALGRNPLQNFKSIINGYHEPG